MLFMSVEIFDMISEDGGLLIDYLVVWNYLVVDLYIVEFDYYGYDIYG